MAKLIQSGHWMPHATVDVVVVYKIEKGAQEVSAYGEFETMIREQRFLLEGLTEMGYRVETHPEGAALIGYHGDERPERAEVIIRRAQLDSASNDIGFVREKDGRFRAIVSDYDRSIGYDDKWLGKVHQHYKEKQTLAMAQAKGYIFRGKEVVQTPNGPQIRLQFVAR